MSITLSPQPNPHDVTQFYVNLVPCLPPFNESIFQLRKQHKDHLDQPNTALNVTLDLPHCLLVLVLVLHQDEHVPHAILPLQPHLGVLGVSHVPHHPISLLAMLPQFLSFSTHFLLSLLPLASL